LDKITPQSCSQNRGSKNSLWQIGKHLFHHLAVVLEGLVSFFGQAQEGSWDFTPVALISPGVPDNSIVPSGMIYLGYCQAWYD
jgi:hypothetical protein